MRHGFAWLADRIVPPANAQGAPEGGAKRGAHGGGAKGGGHGPSAGSASPGDTTASSTGAPPAEGQRAWSKGLTGGRSFGGRGGGGVPGFKPGQVYLLRGGRLSPVRVLTGITDGSMTEVKSDSLSEGSMVVIGTEVAAAAKGNNLQPPPGMGGPNMRGGGRR